ncbi:MAG: CRISPR-associated protein Cas4 [Bacteroidota bacterium]
MNAPITASHITYLLSCHRKLWLHHKQMRMEDNSANVAIGKLIDKTSYKRRVSRWKQLDLDSVKIDHFDPRAKLVKETKKSPKLERVHIAQLKYYLYRMELEGIAGVRGLIEYPRQKRTREVELTRTDREAIIPGWEAEIERITAMENCPELVVKSYCKQCAFYELCYV